MTDQRNLVFAIQRMTHEIAVALERAALGVNQPEAHILAHLAENGESTVADIHRTFGHKRSTLTSILDRLEAREFIERALNENDRRSLVVRLTATGMPVAREVRAWMRGLENDVAARLNDEQMNAVEALMTAVHTSTQPN